MLSKSQLVHTNGESIYSSSLGIFDYSANYHSLLEYIEVGLLPGNPGMAGMGGSLVIGTGVPVRGAAW